MDSPLAPVPYKLQEAIACHQGGRLTDAQALYKEVLKLQPGNSDALHLLGVIAGQTRQPHKAVELISKAIQLAPNNAAAHCNMASALFELREFDAALASFDRAIALRPDYAEAHFNRGSLLADLGQAHAALASFDRAIAARGDFARAHSRRGDVLLGLEHWEQALGSYERALALKADVAETHLSRGNVLVQLRRPAEAVTSYDRAIALDPNLAAAHSSRGAVLNGLGHSEAALGSCDRAIALCPGLAEAHVNRGCALLGLNRVDTALGSFDRAIEIKPELAGAHINRGVALLAQRRVEAALACYDAAIALDSSSAKAHLVRGMARLLIGEFGPGWSDYEWRWRGGLQSCAPGNHCAQPRWLGEAELAGKTILLQCEQGLGDTIQFCRYVKPVAALGARVILQVPKALAVLLESLEGISELVVEGATLPPFDYYCPLLSLPMALRTTLASVPGEVPYLGVSASRKRDWSARLGQHEKPRVGLVWSGGFRPAQPELWAENHRRNIPLAKLASLRHAGLQFYSLQKGQPAESELAQLRVANWDGPEIEDLTSELHDFADTAALIEQLDVVISVDTSTAHVAGALGKPVWILNRFDACWRWLLDRDDTPWYPTARLYRQGSPGDWDGVVRRVRNDLERLERSGRRAQ